MSSSFRGQKINYEDNRCYVVADDRGETCSDKIISMKEEKIHSLF